MVKRNLRRLTAQEFGGPRAPASLTQRFAEVVAPLFGHEEQLTTAGSSPSGPSSTTPPFCSLESALQCMSKKPRNAPPFGAQDGGGSFSIPGWSYGPQYQDDALKDLRQEWQRWCLENHLPERLAQRVREQRESPLFTTEETQWLQNSFSRFLASASPSNSSKLPPVNPTASPPWSSSASCWRIATPQAQKDRTNAAESGSTLAFCKSRKSSTYRRRTWGSQISRRRHRVRNVPTRANQWDEKLAPRGQTLQKSRRSCWRRPSRPLSALLLLPGRFYELLLRAGKSLPPPLHLLAVEKWTGRPAASAS